MKLLRVDEIHTDHEDMVFRQSPGAGLFASISFAAAAAGFGSAGWVGLLPGPVAIVSGALLLVFALIAGRMAWRSVGPHNWLLATNGRRLLIKLRSYLNPEFPSSEACVLELSPDDVIGFRATDSRHTGHDSAGHPDTGSTIFLDIVLNPESNTGELENRLNAERELRTRGGAWRHYPVTIAVNGPTVRLEWRGRHARVLPRIEEAIRLLATFAAPLPPHTETIDFGSTARPPRDATAEQAIRALAQQGRIAEATLLAVRSLRLTVTEARQYVESIATAKALIQPGTNPDAK